MALSDQEIKDLTAKADSCLGGSEQKSKSPQTAEKLVVEKHVIGFVSSMSPRHNDLDKKNKKETRF